MRFYLFGPLSRFGLAVAAIACLLDQASKLYLLFVVDLANGLFQTQGELGAWLLLGFKALAVLLLWLWLARAKDRLTALALGLIIGGAVGNAIDRLAYGWVADFVFFHVSGANWRFQWYVFNLADVAIVAGVIGLLYESVAGERAQKAP
jgi:signal peptidase II